MQSSHRPWKVWKVPEFKKCPGKSWDLLIFLKNPGILHNICSMNFLFEVVYNGFLRNCYVRYSTSFFLVYLPVSRIKI